MKDEDLTVLPYSKLAEYISTCQYRMSEAYGYENQAKDLRERAGVLYAAGDDTKATVYRDLATEFEEEGKKLRRTTHKEYSDLQRTYFAEIERREKL